MTDILFEEDEIEIPEEDDLDWLADDGDGGAEDAEFINPFDPLGVGGLVGKAVGGALGGPGGAWRKPRPKRTVPIGKGRGYYRPTPSRKIVTQAQLRAALQRAGRDVKRNAGAIKAINSRVSENVKTLDAQSAVNAAQAKAIRALKKELDDSRQAILLGQLLAGSGAGGIAKLLPLLMFSGAGGGKGGFDDPLMMLILAEGMSSGASFVGG